MDKQIILKFDDKDLVSKLQEIRKEMEENDVSLKDRKVIVYREFSIKEESVLKGIDVKTRRLRAIVSRATKDRHGDTINPEGWQVDNYRDKNPVLLWAHQYSTAPIGKAVYLNVADDGDMTAEFEFADTEFAKEKFYLYEKGYLNSFSVGFRILKWGTRVTEGDPKGYTFDEQELVEVSAVPVPAHPDANVLRTLFEDKSDEEIKALADSLTEDAQKMEENLQVKDDEETPETPESGDTPEETPNDGEETQENSLDTLAKSIQDNTNAIAEVKSLLGQLLAHSVKNTPEIDKSEESSEPAISFTADELKDLRSALQQADKSIEFGLRKVKLTR